MLLKVLVLCKTKITWHEWPMRQYRWNKKRSFHCSNIGTIFPYIGEQNQVSPNEFFQSSLLSRTCLCLKAFRGQKSLLQNEGDIWGGGGGGGPTQQYRNKNWQIPKSPCRKSTKCRCLIYDRSCLSKVVSISRVWLAQACMHQKSTSTIARECDEKTSSLSAQRYRNARSLNATTIPL